MDVQELGEQIAWRHDQCALENLANVAAMVCTMSQHMKQHFLSCHRSSIAIGELKSQTLRQCLAVNCGNVILKEYIGLCNRKMKFA